MSSEHAAAGSRLEGRQAEQQLMMNVDYDGRCLAAATGSNLLLPSAERLSDSPAPAQRLFGIILNIFII